MIILLSFSQYMAIQSAMGKMLQYYIFLNFAHAPCLLFFAFGFVDCTLFGNRL